MRILVATTHRAIVGGVETYLRDLLPHLRRLGHAVALLSEQVAHPSQPAIGSVDVPLWRLDEDGFGFARRWRPDVCYLHGLSEPTREEALLERFPTVLFAHNYAGTCVSGTKRHALPTPRPCERVLGPGCLLAYLPCRCGGLNPATMLRHYVQQTRRRRLLPRYQAVAVASTHMHQEFRRHVSPERLHLLPLFPAGQQPDPGPLAQRSQTGRVLLVGRLTQLKGGTLLVEAVRRAQAALGRPLTLVVAGDGPERGRIEAGARRAGVAVEMAGWVGQTRRAELMRSADVLALPGTWPEPFGLVGIEAGCVGLPAAAFAVGGIPDWLLPGESGELAPGDPPSPRGLADALVRTLGDPEHLHRLREGAWRVAQRFSVASHLDRLEEILAGASSAQVCRTLTS
jgi:glycosyltransferase involved in cell wall biosynthesis